MISSLPHPFSQISAPATNIHHNETSLISMPVAKKVWMEHKLHGDSRIDYYHWMSNKDDPDFLVYLQDWNRYTDQVLRRYSQLTEEVFTDLSKRLKDPISTLPYQVGSYLYYKKLLPENEHALYCRKKVSGQTEEVLLNPNVFSKECTYIDIKEFLPSPDGKFAAIMIDIDGSQFGSTCFLNLETGQYLNSEILTETNGNVVWNSQSSGIWYVKLNDLKRFDKICFHSIGNDPKNDEVYYEEKDKFFDLFLTRDKLQNFLIITSLSKDVSEIVLCPLDQPHSPPKMVCSRQKKTLYTFVPAKNNDFLFSHDKIFFRYPGVDWQLMETLSPNDSIDGMEVFENYLVSKKRIKGFLRIEVRHLKTGKTHYIPLPQELCEVEFYYNTHYCSSSVRFIISSPIHPPSIHDWNMDEKKMTLVWKDPAGGFDTSQYTSERIYVDQAGTPIPVSLFYKKGLPRDGSRPLRLYGYGAYGLPLDPSFSALSALFLERDCFYAIAHVRGGGDLGRAWYEDGRLLKKNNTFNDFIACAEALIAQGYTSKERLAVEGGSAGGLVMGVIMNKRRDLFKVCLADVPFVDVVTTMLDPKIPLSDQEKIEWGDPNIKEYYQLMKSYSPKDNVQYWDGPHLIVTGGKNDLQVLIREPAKWVAELAEKKVGNNYLLFKTNLEAGHNWKSGRFELLREIAPIYAFILAQIGAGKEDSKKGSK